MANTEKNANLESQLQAEYLLLIERWDDFDKRALGIKGWVAAGMVVAVAGFHQKPDLWVPLLVAVLVLTAWFLEAIWKAWQHSNGPRISRIEAYFRGERLDIKPLQIQAALRTSYGSGFSYRKTIKEMKQPFVMLPYIIFIIISIGFSALHVFGYYQNDEPNEAEGQAATNCINTCSALVAPSEEAPS